MSEFSYGLILYLLKQPLIIIILVLGIIGYFFYNNIVGFFGELWVKLELRKLSKEYLILNNIMIRTKDNITHQIDHLIISSYGIFVIETKQYDGYITGNEYKSTWRFKAGRKIFYINNPIKQNYGHIKALEEVLNISEDKFINIVCIPSRATVKVKSSKVTRIYTLLPKILSYKETIIDNKDEIFNNIQSLNIIDKKIRREHVKELKRKYNSKE